MKKLLMLPVLAAGLFATACSDDGDPTTIDTRAKVRFFNAVWNTSSGIGLTANGQFATGSAIAYGQSSQTCSSLNAGNATFGIGLATAGGSALTGPAIATLPGQTITEGGDYTVLTGGAVVHPSVILLDNSFSGTLGTNQAAVRFVNLAAQSEFPFTVLKGAAGSGTVVQTDLAFRGATAFSSVTSGSNAYTIMENNNPVISGSAATLTLQGGTINTVVIVRDPITNNFQLRTVSSCS